jgi:hypothetical protein
MDNADRHFFGCYAAPDRKINPFQARMTWKGNSYRLGSYPTAPAAGKAHDWAARLIGDHRPLNYPPGKHLGDEPRSDGANRLRSALAARRDARGNGDGEYIGCSLKSSGKVQAQIRWKGTM